MTIRLKHLNSDLFVRVDKRILNDPSISWKAKGILIYALSKPEINKSLVGNLREDGKNGRDSIFSGLKELENAGYLIRDMTHNSYGRFDHIWKWFSTPTKTGVSK